MNLGFSMPRVHIVVIAGTLLVTGGYVLFKNNFFRKETEKKVDTKQETTEETKQETTEETTEETTGETKDEPKKENN